MRRRALLLTGIAVLSSAPAAGAVAPSCFGARATIVGTPGDDELEGTDRADVIVALGGTDRIEGKGGDDRICAGPGGGYRHPQGLNDLEWEVVHAGPGDDMVAGGAGPDQLFGETGDDRIYLGDGGADDTHSVDNDGIGGRGNDLIVGTRASDHFVGGKGHDRTAGRGGADYFVAGRGRDRLNGGSGRDYVYYVYLENGITADLRRGRVKKGGTIDVVASIEDVSGTVHDDVLRGDAAPNLFYGDNGDDVIRGRGGDDCLLGVNGTNEVFGGAGYDYYAISAFQGCRSFPGNGSEVGINPTGSINVDLAEGRAWRVGEESALHSIEGAYGGFSADMLFGDDRANEFYGGPSRDEIHARGGDDYLDGGKQTDTLDGGPGSDECVRGEIIAMCE